MKLTTNGWGPEGGQFVSRLEFYIGEGGITRLAGSSSLRMSIPHIPSQRPSAKQVSSCERVTRTLTGCEQGITIV